VYIQNDIQEIKSWDITTYPNYAKYYDPEIIFMKKCLIYDIFDDVYYTNWMIYSELEVIVVL